MRIAIFTDTFLPQVNGVSNTLKRLGIYLEEQGIDYLFVTPEQKSDEEIPYHMESFLSTKFFLYPECRLTFVNPIRLTKKLDDFRPDLVFAMTEFTMGFAGLQYAKKRKLPFITNYSTNFTSILKAFASGIPVIGANAGGVKHLIEHGTTGFLTHPRDAVDFAQKIIQLIEDDELRKKMSENARIYASKKSWRKVFEQLISDFEGVLTGVRERENDIA